MALKLMPPPDVPAAAGIAVQIQTMGKSARAAAAELALASAETRNRALTAAAAAIRNRRGEILDANKQDIAAAQKKELSAALLDRLKLDDKRIEATAKGLEEIAAFPDPLGTVLAEWTRPNGLTIQRVRVPLGVIGIIYESRPNVTADAGGLCIKSGNAAILRGGSECFHSSRAIHAALADGLRAANLPAEAVQLVPTTDRAAVGEMLRLNGYIDIIVPRGGKELIERVQSESSIPVIAHLHGNCHTYVDGGADPIMARQIVLNAKMRRTGVCGATETLLVDRRAIGQLPTILNELAAAGCEIRGDAETRALDRRVKPASDADWDTEFLDAIIAVKIVTGVDEAIAHINRHGSHHTEAIVTQDGDAARRFIERVDAAIVMHNASTQFADGGEFGMGAEIGISTNRLPPRGPVGAEQLTTYKYVLHGSGQTRP
jgi:glutamate-5-semialdehyde dehydrogenase